MNTLASTVNIAPDGDVVLLVGTSKVRLRVNSKTLKSFSKFFGVMLGPNWREGQNLSKDSPGEVDLPKDNAMAMQLICCVLHHRNELVPDKLTPTETLYTAVILDKYDISPNPLKYALLDCLRPSGRVTMIETAQLLAAAVSFDCMEMAKVHTAALVLDYSESYLAVLDDVSIKHMLPAKACFAIQERRSKTQAKLIQLWNEGAVKRCGCGWDTHKSEIYRSFILKYPLIKLMRFPLSFVISETRAIFESMGKHNVRCTVASPEPGPAAHHHSLSQYQQLLFAKLDAVKEVAGVVDFF